MVLVLFSRTHLNDHIDPHRLILTIESRMVNVFCASYPISLQHLSFCCPFLATSLAIYHSNESDQVRRETT